MTKRALLPSIPAAVAMLTLPATGLAWRIEIGGTEIKGDDPKVNPPKIEVPKIEVPKLPNIELPKLPDPTKKEFWEKPGAFLLPGAQLLPGVGQATTQAVEQIGNAVLKTARTAANETVKTLVNAQGDIITTVQKAGTDAVQTFEKASKDATATYFKAWKDSAAEAQRSLNNVADAAVAIKRFGERDLQARIKAAENAVRRANEGKFLDAVWHLNTEPMQATEENYFKATQESTLINSAGQAAATTYGGPGGAAAYAAWYTYRTTGDPEMAIRAGVLSAITSQGGSAVSGMPAGTATEVIKKAAVAGAVGGLAVAAAGGDEKAITDGFLRSGGTVLIQSGTDSFKMHNPKTADALQTVHCLSARDVDCLANTTYVKEKGKILFGADGKPKTEKYIPKGIAKWTHPAPGSPEEKQVAFITGVAKLAKSGEVPVLRGKWVVTTTLGRQGQQLADKVPAVVLTYAGADPPFEFRSDYEYGEQLAGYFCRLGSSVRRVSVTRMGSSCHAVYFREGESQTVFSSTHHAEKCLAAAGEFVKVRMKQIGATCTKL